MPRIRTVKPEIAKHEVLFDLEVSTGTPMRFLWAMLPTVCDREGRFKWRPRALKPDLLPYDEADLSGMLECLLNEGMLIRYEVEGQEYGCIPTFLKHQSPNTREAQSDIPPPPDEAHARTCTHATSDDPAPGERKGKERKGRSTAQARRTPFPDDLETLPDDWRDKAKAYWKRKSRPDIDPDDEFEKFKARCIRDGAKYIDWPSAWQTWYTNAVKFNDAPVRRSTSNIRHIDEVMEEERRLLNERPR